MIAEIIGYVASFLIAASLLMVSIVRLRLINLAGSITFVVYGIMISSFPVILTNGFITLVNIYYLYMIFRKHTGSVQYISLEENRKFRYFDFFEANREDILRYFPRFRSEQAEKAFAGKGFVYLCLKELDILGCAVLLPPEQFAVDGHPEEVQALSFIREELYPEKTLYVVLDYVVPSYRDLDLERKLIRRIERDFGPSVRFLATAADPARRKHLKFLKRNGYRKVREFGSIALFIRTLTSES